MRNESWPRRVFAFGERGVWGRVFVRIRIRGIIGFSGFCRLVFKRQALVLAGFRLWRKPQVGRIEILKILILTTALLPGKRSSTFVSAEFRSWRKGRVGESEILKIPTILKILILTKPRVFARQALIPIRFGGIPFMAKRTGWRKRILVNPDIHGEKDGLAKAKSRKS